MNVRGVAVAVLGVLSVVVGLLFLLWPGGAYLAGDRIAVALLFLIPGVIGLDSARRTLQ
ncbi:MAG: hypothetical protein U5J98_06590 [Halobacteriales archaeon]|nr:hypothetical protein [Halobacteriales archaeon]